MDQTVVTIIGSALPTLAVLAAFVRNESAIASLGSRIDDSNKRIESLNRDMNLRFETLTRDMQSRFETLTRRVGDVDADLREWARISMRHNTDIARLKDKTGLPE